MSLDTINVDTIEYQVADLAANEKEMVTLYEQWAEDASAAKREMLKNQAAMRDVANELIRNVREYDGHTEKVATATAAAEAATPPAAEAGTNIVDAIADVNAETPAITETETV